MAKGKYTSKQGRLIRHERIVSRMLTALNGIHRKAADYLNTSTARWSRRRFTLLLILFCLMAGGWSLFIAVKGFMPANGPPSVQRTKLSKPNMITDSIFNHHSKKFQNDNITQ